MGINHLVVGIDGGSRCCMDSRDMVIQCINNIVMVDVVCHLY